MSTTKHLVYTETRWRLICAIQREVNTLLTYKREPKGSDHWKIILGPYGAKADCEDYALTKWTLLLAAGFPPNSLWPILCVKNKQPHMCLVISFESQDYVMDLSPNWIISVDKVPYKWLAAYDGHNWRGVSLSS